MPYVSPFHSDRPRDRAVYHNNRCGPSTEIPPANRVSGTGGRRLCDDCEKMNRDGK